ncbi:hypothetical protein DFH28DRAFT_927442 [Melampsora americana]|nr:hypothetical protein DFH28DRAFT_927442 [Melampsora americana]
MITCICSNCAPKSADFFLAQQPSLTVSNFTDLVLQEDPPDSYPTLDEQFIDLDKEVPSPYTNIRPSQPDNPLIMDLRLIRLRLQIERGLKTLFDGEYPQGGFYTMNDLFLPHKIWSVCVNYDLLLEGMDLDYFFGSEPLPNAYEVILQVIQAWRGNKRDFFAILDPSEEELSIYNHAKAKLAQTPSSSQRNHEGIKATPDQDTSAATSDRNKRKVPTKRLRAGKKAKSTGQTPDLTTLQSKVGNQ